MDGRLSDCENEVGWGVDDNTMYFRRKECLFKKCKNFTNNSLAQKGCLFLANFLESAGNPLHTFIEIKCPSVFKDKY